MPDTATKANVSAVWLFYFLTAIDMALVWNPWHRDPDSKPSHRITFRTLPPKENVSQQATAALEVFENICTQIYFDAGCALKLKAIEYVNSV